MSPGAITCSVLVPVLNEERHIIASVAAMCQQRCSGQLEFLLVDGGSDDNTRELLRQLADEDPRIRLLENPRRATPSGLNVGLAKARGRFVARMDAHTRYPAEYLSLAMGRVALGDTRWVSGPPIAVGEGTVSRAVALALRTPLGRGGSRKWASEPGADNDDYELDSGVFTGVWERETLLQHGGWDEEWPRNQDSEMAGRFLASGEKLICIPAMAAEYTPRGSLRSLWRQYLEYGEYREKTAVRHPHTMRRSHLFAPSLVLTLPAAAIAPRPLRKLARLSLLTYVAALLAASARAFKESERPEDAALVPVVLATMHLAHGAGSYRGAVRYGLPLSSLASVAGLAQLSRRLRPGPTPVFAPSLSDDSSAAGKRPHLPLDPLGPPARREPMRPITNPTQPATSTLARLSGSAGRVTTRSLGRDI